MEGLSIFKDYFNNIKRNMILNSYYTRKIKDGKSMKASFLDWISITILVMLFFLITIFNSTKNIIWSIILTLVLMLIYLFMLITWNNRTRTKKINIINENIAEEEILKGIDRQSNDDFLLYTKDLLEKYYKTIFFEYNNRIDFFGEINREIYGVKCIRGSLESKITLKDIEYYILDMKKKNIDEGIIVTNSYFTEEVKEETNYILMDFDQIKNMLRETNQFPTKEEIEDIVIKQYEGERETLKEKLSFQMKDKIYKLILLGIGLYIVSSFVSYPLYYKVIAFILITIGMIIGIYNIILYFRKRKKIEI
ncbi:MAG: restriction endonuclease [Tissierellia bacterium]|nr:restriction endonuclease [Tissierellia bacterium]